MADGLVTLFLCGDVMLGRGVDQVLPHPGDPALRESWARDARAYVHLAERARGPIPQPAGFSWPGGEALEVIDCVAPEIRGIKLAPTVPSIAGCAPTKQVSNLSITANRPTLPRHLPHPSARIDNSQLHSD